MGMDSAKLTDTKWGASGENVDFTVVVLILTSYISNGGMKVFLAEKEVWVVW